MPEIFALISEAASPFEDGLSTAVNKTADAAAQGWSSATETGERGSGSTWT
ncbi:MAG: hypothetical protein JEZ04_19585 [Spirochaetales bacterium]|nr:hypothetical protein [Spirochaetales bacterium]